MDPIERTAQYEKFINHRYLDSKGIPTIGYGHKILPGENMRTIDEKTARELLAREWGEKVNEFYKRVPEAHNYPQGFQEALWDMAYNMGPDFMRKFPDAKAYLDQGKYTQAAFEFGSGSKPGTKSKYLKETKNRAVENIRKMLDAAAQGQPTGKWVKKPDGTYQLTLEKRVGLGGFNAK